MQLNPLNSPSKLGFKIVADFAVAIVSYILAFYIRMEIYIPVFKARLPSDKFYGYQHEWLLIGVSQIVVLYFFGLYSIRTRPRPGFFTPVFASAFVQSLVLISFYYVTEQFDFPRSVFLIYFF